MFNFERESTKYHFTAPAFFVFIIITFEYLFCCVCCAIFNNYSFNLEYDPMFRGHIPKKI